MSTAKNDDYVSTYSDPTADIVLISDEGTRFKVHSYYLKAFSSVFRDMLCSPLPHTSDHNKPDNPNEISLDVPTEELTIMLDMLYRREGTRRPSLATWEKVVGFALKFEFDIQLRLMGVDLRERAGENPWTAFCIGARLEDMKLMVAAISALRHTQKFDGVVLSREYSSYLCCMSFEQFARCPPAYVFRFVQSVAKYERTFDFKPRTDDGKSYLFTEVASIFESGKMD